MTGILPSSDRLRLSQTNSEPSSECSWGKLSGGWTFEDVDLAMNGEGVESEGAVEKNIVTSILILAKTTLI